ncbi:beta-1,3-galactosyltransferase bre-5-like [Mytilus edulis]|uniref:beta-1,3-galactosyltransferase bre-5-like n=1 Tax=Mytilus edulis TaxID=6550 RepID=UPI0039EE37CF
MKRMPKISFRRCGRNKTIFILLMCGYCSVQIAYLQYYYTYIDVYMNLDFLIPNLEVITDNIQETGTTKVEPLNIFRKEDAYIIDPSEKICDNSNCDNLKLLLVVKSYVLNFGQRNAIRKTWGGIDGIRTKVIFITGYIDGVNPSFIEIESKLYKDILQLNIEDTYENLVYKTIYSLLWLSDLDIPNTFVHFVDDDRLVNTFNVYNVAINSMTSDDLVIIGYKLDFSKPQRGINSKVYISPNEYPFSYFPSYIIGGTILTNMKTVKLLALGVAYAKIIQIEDSFIGIIATAFNIEMKHHPGFLPYKQKTPNHLPEILSSPGYELTYALLRDWKIIEKSHTQLLPASLLRLHQ